MKDYRVKDINSLPCARRINGEKCIKVTGNTAIVQFADGARWYRRKDENSDWIMSRQTICTNC